MTIIQGIDFSEGGFPSIATLKARGIGFVGRYGVTDRSPKGRGLNKDESDRYLANGVDEIIYYERTAGWMVGGVDAQGIDNGPGGWEAGVAGAQDAQRNLVDVGLPFIPIHFCYDVDPDPSKFSILDQCLSGAASIVGWDRIGAYGGHLWIAYLAQGGNVKYLAETIAWQYGRGWHPAATIQQYDTANVPFDGVPCDLLRAMVHDYGQASLHKGTPVTTTPAPKPPASQPKADVVPGVTLPAGMTVQLLERLFTGSALNQIVIGGETERFSPTGAVSLAWLHRGIASIPKGKTWREGSWPQLKDRVRRGKNGADGTDWVLATGDVIHTDAGGHVTA